MPQKTLSLFKNFKCKSCVKCSTSSWMVTLNRDDFRLIKTIVTSKYGKSKLSKYVTSVSLPDRPNVVAIINKHDDNRCVFLNPKSKHCDLQKEFGHESLPLGCKAFPRYRVKVGENNFYHFSAVCPSVREMYAGNSDFEVVSLPEKTGDHYPGAVSNTDALVVTMSQGRMTDTGFFLLQRHFVSMCARDEFESPETLLSYFCIAMMEISAVQKNDDIDELKMQTFLDQHQDHLLRKACSSGKNENFKVSLDFMRSWFELRQSEGVIDDPVILDLVQKFCGQGFDESCADFQKKYRETVVSFLKKNDAIWRNYLAGKIYHAPYVFEYDCFAFWFFYIFLPWSLVKIIVIQHVVLKNDCTAKDLLDAIAVVDSNTLHARGMELKLLSWSKTQPGLLQQLFAFI